MKKYNIQIDNARDELFTDFGSAVLKDRYLLEGETQQELFKRVALAYSDNEEHAQRIYDYISKMWFMPATPILANGGLQDSKSLPISCFINEVQDTIDGVLGVRNENGYLSTSGGGIGSYFGNIRQRCEKISNRGEALGVIPQIKVLDSMTLADTQSGIRRGSAAVYIHDNHPEIEEFIDIRRPTGDSHRRSLNIHHAVCISDEFMKAVEQGAMWELKSPKDGRVVEEVNARNLWIKILTARIETGEPYILFTGNVNKNKSKVYTELEYKYGQKVKTSNLCNEIMLLTGFDHLQKERTAVCCLSSLNLEYFDEWKNNELFIEDVARFLDNVLQDFIDRAPNSMQKAKYSAMRERSIGIGVMGFHSFLQSKKTPFASVSAKSWNKAIFKHIKEKCDIANEKLANEKGACPDALELGINHRFSNMQAIAPTASISNICGESSPGIEPYAANVYTQKTLSGSFIVRNKSLKKLLKEKGYDTEAVWSSISLNEGSVQHLDFLNQDEKDVFKTAMEIDQMWIIEHASDRQQYIDQGQSVNMFFASNVEKSILHKIHFAAWKKGVKGLYYCRSASIQRAEKSEDKFSKEQEKAKEVVIPTQPEYDECLACQ
jgi:ribonucleoside-diphosphate reductase alpha chain